MCKVCVNMHEIMKQNTKNHYDENTSFRPQHQSNTYCMLTICQILKPYLKIQNTVRHTEIDQSIKESIHLVSFIKLYEVKKKKLHEHTVLCTND